MVQTDHFAFAFVCKNVARRFDNVMTFDANSSIGKRVVECLSDVFSAIWVIIG